MSSLGSKRHKSLKYSLTDQICYRVAIPTSFYVANRGYCQLMTSNAACASVTSRYKCLEIPDFPSATGVLRRLICPKFVFGRALARASPGRANDALPDSLVGWGYPLPIPYVSTHSTPTASRSRGLWRLVPNFIFSKLKIFIHHQW